MTFYLSLSAIIYAWLLASVLSDEPRRWSALFFAALVALSWPLVLLLCLDGAWRKWKAEREVCKAYEAYRKARERMRA